jgi:hypothetical protein
MILKFKNQYVYNLTIGGVDSGDYPDFCDAHFASGEWQDSSPLTDEELAVLSAAYPEVLNEMAHEHSYELSGYLRDQQREQVTA